MYGQLIFSIGAHINGLVARHLIAQLAEGRARELQLPRLNRPCVRRLRPELYSYFVRKVLATRT